MISAQESVSIIIPTFQESETIGLTIKNIKKILETLTCQTEVIVVCDGSTDLSGDIAEEAGADRVIRHSYNKGYGAALKTGIRASNMRTVLFIDADGQHDPKYIPQMILQRATNDMVVGARKGTAASPLWRKPGKIFLGWMANRLTGANIPDLNSGLRALDRKMALSILLLMPDGFSFSTTSTIAAFKGGYSISYIPIEIFKRAGNKSTVRVMDGFKTIMLIIRIITLFSPLRIFLPISLITFLIGLGFTINGYYTLGESSVKGLIALLASVLFFLFGILVDQISAVRRGEIIK
jgi:glycosyltransferase involved in cell wall biosynthesis